MWRIGAYVVEHFVCHVVWHVVDITREIAYTRSRSYSIAWHEAYTGDLYWIVGRMPEIVIYTFSKPRYRSIILYT